MRWCCLLPLLLVLHVTGCTSNRAQQEALGADTESLKRQVQQLQAENQELHVQLDRSQTNAQNPSPGSTPKYVCAALVEHFYLELAAGKAPRDMLAEKVQVGFAAQGYPAVEDAVPADKVDFESVVQWVKKTPISSVRAVSLPLSQPGYQRVDLEFTNGFTVSGICHQYKIERFLILDHDPGMS